MDERIRVSAIDDHPMFLEGLRRAVRQTPDVELVAEGCTADDACRIAETVKPDVMLLDIGIPGDGLKALRRILSMASPVTVIMLTASDSDEHVAEALAAGAKGYLVKGAGASEVIEAIRSVRSNIPYISTSVASRLLIQKVAAERAQQGGGPAASPSGYLPRSLLSQREQQIVDYASQGLTNKEIADKLGLSVRTVKREMSIILQKLQVRSRLAAAVARLNNS